MFLKFQAGLKKQTGSGFRFTADYGSVPINRIRSRNAGVQSTASLVVEREGGVRWVMVPGISD